MCLREARRGAGLVSIVDAARETNRSPESIGRHERGEVNLHPVDVLQYAQTYGSPDLLLRYCNECPICQALNEDGVQDRDLPQGALKISVRLHQAARQAEVLEVIAEDGMIDHSEVNQFNAVVDFLREISAATRELMLYAMSAGIIIPEGMKKDRTAVTVPAHASIAR
jgi:hypothetical protein